MAKFETVEIAGQKYPVSFGWMALAKFTKRMGISLNELTTLVSSLDLESALILILEGLRDGHRKKQIKKDFTLTVEDVADMLDEDADALGRMLEVFTQSIPVAKEGVEMETDTEKKIQKQTHKK